MCIALINLSQGLKSSQGQKNATGTEAQMPIEQVART